VSIVVDILLLQTVSLGVASASIVVAVVYYIIQIQQQKKIRQTDLVTNLYSTYSSEAFQKEWHKFMTEELGTLKAYQEKFGMEYPPSAVFFNEVGILLEKGLIDIDLVNSLFGGVIPRYWKKLKPFLESCRMEVKQPNLGRGLEYLGNEIQKLQPKKD
jgi:hypothetical protein